MSEVTKNIDNTSENEVLSNTKQSVVGDIYVQDVHKSFGVTKALDGVNFSANFGEIHAIVGPNGCCKSTLAKVLSGVLPIDKGKVSVVGHFPTSPVMARDLGIATVFQEVMIADEASVVDNLFIGSDDFWYKSLTHREKVKKAEELMEDLVVDDIDPNTLALDLSLPIKAWITIGRAFLRENTKVLILDESSAALDFDSTERLFKKMRELRDSGMAVFIVTHRIAELIRISDKATVMRDGVDVGVLDKKDLNEKNLLSLMTGKVQSGEKSKTVAVQTKSDKVVLNVKDLDIDQQVMKRISKFTSIKHILKNFQGDQEKIFDLLNEIVKDLKNYELELRIEKLESKFAEDFSENTFDKIKELKKLQNIN